MAKSKNKKSKKTPQRYANVISRRSLLRSPLKDLNRSKPFKLGDDRREWRPEHDRARRQIDGRRVRFTETTGKNPKSNNRYRSISYANPHAVTICHRRKRRREALFASGKAGTGKSIKTPRKYNQDTKIKCRRK